MQQFQVSISIPIPEDSILIKKVEFEELKNQSLTGVYWNMRDLEFRTKRKSEWIKEHILYPSRFRKILDSETGGFVFYPKKKGQTWAFQANKMAAFLDKYFQQIFS
ncbi:DUF771 domain-containing protein [Heyndrickxia oleronia]|uniref:DUF771 domain-containing protein n=1 Tax=Heyndrickxia oleronia TaxID=38875 RepID=UPI001C0EB88F|nr:DUF771 domain-containing protein [Heyndrickxia oleronia]MBU5212463.1 DUF771 domain-containing protein [Heyndrickxia oleronia]